MAEAPAWRRPRPPGTLSYLFSFSNTAVSQTILCLGLNIQWGYIGHLNFGNIGFFALCAFTTTLVSTAAPTGTLAQCSQQALGLGLPFSVGILAGAEMVGVIAFLISIPVVCRRIDFVVIAPIGIAEIRAGLPERAPARQRTAAAARHTAGAHCLFEEPAGSWLPGSAADVLAPLGQRDDIYFSPVVAPIFLFLVYPALDGAVVRSPRGRTLHAARDDEASTVMNGKTVMAPRIQSFIVGVVVMGISGALYAHYAVTIGYSHFNPFFVTVIVWVMLMLRGAGDNRRAILGTFIIWRVWSGTAFLAEAGTCRLNASSPCPTLPPDGHGVRRDPRLSRCLCADPGRSRPALVC